LYNSKLGKVRGIVTPPEKDWATSVYWMYSILVKPEYGMSRDELMKKLSDYGVETRPFFVPTHRQPVFAPEFAGEKYEVAEMLSETGINLPSGNTLTQSEVETVSEIISN
jgi:perosamine synthetase